MWHSDCYSLSSTVLPPLRITILGMVGALSTALDSSCHMGTAVKHPVPDRVKQSFDRVPGCQKLQIMVWHRMLYSCRPIHIATVGVKGNDFELICG